MNTLISLVPPSGECHYCTHPTNCHPAAAAGGLLLRHFLIFQVFSPSAGGKSSFCLLPFFQKAAFTSCRFRPEGATSAARSAAAGAGLSIALACDLRVASVNAFVTTAFGNIGLSGDYGASWFLPRLIGLSKAKEMFYTSSRIGAEECERLGLFNKIFPVDTFREEAQAYASRLSNGPVNALARMKKNLNNSLEQDLDASLRLEAKHLVESMDDPESKEAIAAFMEKRKPNFPI